MKDQRLYELNEIPKGSSVIIMEVPDEKRRSQLIRLGIAEGEYVKCLEKLPGGTTVIEKNRREIAIGSSLAKSILVRRAESRKFEEGLMKENVFTS